MFARRLLWCHVSLFCLARFAVACPFCQQKDFIHGGVEVMGNGTVRSWVALDEKRLPKAVGFTFSESALEGLPMKKPDNGMDGYEYLILLPKEAAAAGIDHISVDWNPFGHIPEPIYTVPHFDFHFYFVSTAERQKITLDAESMKKCQKKPDAAFLPPDFFYAPQSEYKYMGAHWVDPKTPELNGNPFTHTFIYGTYDAKVIFIEPMVTMDVLKSKQNIDLAVPQPKKFSGKGSLYPTRYTITFDSIRKEYTVALTGFKKK